MFATAFPTDIKLHTNCGTKRTSFKSMLVVAMILYKPFHCLLLLHICYLPHKYFCHVLYTYIIGHYNPSVRFIDLVSHTTYVVCVNFIHKWQNLQFKVDSERKIFWETFHGSLLIYSQRFCPESAERTSPKKYFSYFVFMSGLGLEPWLYI